MTCGDTLLNFITYVHMSSNSPIRTLLNPPSLQASHTKAKEEINNRFLTIDDLENLDFLVPEFRARQDELKKTVRPCTQQHFFFIANIGSSGIHFSNVCG